MKEKGLSSKKAIALLSKYGRNALKEQQEKPFIVKFFEQFNNFLTFLLIAAAFFSFIIREPVDGSLILMIVILNALFGLYQESKAEAAIAALKTMMITKSRVIRDGVEREVDSELLVPGDVVMIEEGTKISADGVLVEVRHLEINEAALTGESIPVAKKDGALVFSGTIVASGRGMFRVERTGMDTKFGAIALKLTGIKEGPTPLQKKLSELTRMIGIFGMILAAVVFVVSRLEGSSYFPAFLLSISLAVAVVPEGLPAVMTITLSLGVSAMVKKKAIIRRLSAIEALGSVTLIATDKTGTLTTNKMKVTEIYVDNKVQTIDQRRLKMEVEDGRWKSMKLLLLNGILCSTASLTEGGMDVLGDPTEGALLYLAHDAGMNPALTRHEWKVLDEKPFDSVTKMMSVMVERSNIKDQRSKLFFSKGAPESILSVSKMTESEKEKVMATVTSWAKRGLRVLAFAYSSNSTNLTDPTDLVFLGMVAIHDAPRPEIVEAVRKAESAGIRVIMITGDNEITAEAVGKLAGLLKPHSEIVTGVEIDKYSDEELLKAIPKIAIFARTNPFQKHRVVELYQKLGEIVAVTGDGVNDAIALKQADVGVAMGLIGTDVARETADMVITDDNFATIVNAVEEGRNIIKNLKNAIGYLLSCNISEAIALVVALVMGIPTLFTPLQLLYINLVTDGLPALSLSFSPRDESRMKTPPVKNLELLSNREKIFIFLVGLVSSALVISSYFLFGSAGRTAAFTILTLIQSFILIDAWLSHRNVVSHAKELRSPFLLIAFLIPLVLQFVIATRTSAAAIFKIPAISNFHYLQLILISSLVLVAVSGIKRITRRI